MASPPRWRQWKGVLHQVVAMQERIGNASNPFNDLCHHTGHRASGHQTRLPHFFRPMATRAFAPEVDYSPHIFALGC